MTSTLTERYIAAVTRRLPADMQEDVRGELAASVADDIDARVAAGETQGDAERAVLIALGDPDALAAGYADRPLHLIGPRYYLTWWRLLKLLLWIVPICGVVGVTIGKLLEDAPVGEVIGAVFAVGLGAIVHTAFWTTLVFFILDRSGADASLEWDIDTLPEPAAEQGSGRADLIATLVFLGIAAAAILWDRFIGFAFFAPTGADVTTGLGAQTVATPILNPELWPWWLGGLLVLMAMEAALAVAVYAQRGWNAGLAALNTILAVVVSSGALYLLLTGQLVNPVFLEFTLGRPDVPADVGRILVILTGLSIAGVAVWDVVDGWLKTARARRAA